MIRYFLGAAAIAASVGVPAQAETSPTLSGDTAVDALAADIAAGRRDAAIARISAIESITGMARLVTTPAQFVDRLLGCTPLPAARSIAGMATLDWTCADGIYRTSFDSKYSAPYITVAEFADPARVAVLNGPARVAPPPLPLAAPPAPPRPGEKWAYPVPSTHALELFANAIKGKKPEDIAALVSPDARITFGRRDIVARVTVAELDGLGPAALLDQLGVARTRMGAVASVQCEVQGAVAFCTAKSKMPRTGVVAMISGNGETISSVQMMYVAP